MGAGGGRGRGREGPPPVALGRGGAGGRGGPRVSDGGSVLLAAVGGDEPITVTATAAPTLGMSLGEDIK